MSPTWWMCNILYVCTKNTTKSHPKRVCWSPDMTFLFCFSAFCSLWSLQGESQLFSCRGRLYDLQSLRRRGSEEHRYRWKNSKRRLIFSIWHIAEWASCHIINSVLFFFLFLKMFSCSIRCGEGTHRGGAVEKSHLQCGHHPEQQSVPGDGSERYRDHSGQQIQVSVAPSPLPPPLPPDSLLLLTGCVALVSQISPPSRLGGAGGAVAHRLHQPRVSGLHHPAGGLCAGATVSELPGIVKPRNAAEQISDQHFLNWAMNGSVQRGYR